MVLKGEEIVLVIMGGEVFDSHHWWEQVTAVREIERHTVSR
jgi:hypothetical protein